MIVARTTPTNVVKYAYFTCFSIPVKALRLVVGLRPQVGYKQDGRIILKVSDCLIQLDVHQVDIRFHIQVTAIQANEDLTAPDEPLFDPCALLTAGEMRKPVSSKATTALRLLLFRRKEFN